MRKHLSQLLVFLILCISSKAQSDCSSAIIINGNTQSYNPSGIGDQLEQLACGGIEHNSIWLAFQAKTSGKLNFVIRPFTPSGLPTSSDFDWSLWALPGAPGTTNCNDKTQLSCNFSGAGTGFGIPGATGLASPPFTVSQFNPGVDVTSGNWYAIIIDQFSNTTPLLFSVQFTGNSESTYLNATPGIFDNRPDFIINNTGGCNGAYSFSSTSVATAGIASYKWDFGDGTTSTAMSPTKNYLVSGTYYVTLTITDNNGAKSDIRKAVVYNPTALTLTAGGILVTSSCSDVNNGTLTISTTGATTTGVSGGTPPYSFELVSPSPMIRAAQNSNSFTALQPGAYTVKATDACGRSATASVTIAQVATNATIGLGIQNTQAACSSSPTGTVTLFANGTVPPYSMQLVNSSPVVTAVLPTVQRDPVTATYYATFTNLLPGLYTVDCSDGCGRVRRATFTVTASTAPVASAVASASCAGTPTGTLTVTATAATGLSGTGTPGNFQYALIAPSPIIKPYQNSSVFERLYPGTYTIAVKDACGNVGTSNVNIAVAGAPTFGTSFTTLSCPNGATGSLEAQINTAGGGSPYTFELINPSPVTRPAQADNAFGNLPPGAYTVKLTDGCGTTATATVTISAATAPTFTTALTGSCSGVSSGTITVTPGATSIGPFSFELISPGAAIRLPQGSNIANTTNSVFTGLDQGGYTVKMTDGCGVPVTNSAAIVAPTALAFPSGSTTVPACSAGNTGRITVAIPTTGLAAYKYELIAPSAVTRPIQYSRIFDGLPVGSYTVRITDSCGTQVTIGAPLTIAAATAPAVTVSNTSSCATASGTITCSPGTSSQGGGTYLYALVAPSVVTRSNQSSPIFTGLPAGAYTVQITDQCGTTGTSTTTIAAAGAFTPAAGGSVAKCSGTGYIGQLIVTTPQNFTAGGPIPTGSGGGPYTYALYDATNTTLLASAQSSNVFSNVAVAAGSPSHTIRVMDACGNTSTVAVTLNAPTALSSAVITATTASCSAAATGVIKVTTQASGGLAPYTYTLIDASTSATVSGPITGTTFTNIAANATGYLIRATDACGNTSTSATALLFPAAAVPTVTAATVPSCGASATGKITLTAGTGATLAGGTFSYALYDASNITQVIGVQSSPVFNNVAAGTYTARIVDRCSTVGTVSVVVSATVTAATASGTASGTCSAAANGVITAASTGGSLPITYSLVDQVTNNVVAAPQSSTVFSGLTAGTYLVRVTDACGTVTNSSNVVVSSLIATPTITTTSATDCGGFVVLSGYGGGGNGGPFTYSLCNGAGCSSFGTYDAASTFTINTSGTYRINVKDRCGNSTSSADVVVSIPVKPTLTSIAKSNACGVTAITPTFSGVSNTAYYSVDGGNFTTSLPMVMPGCHALRVADNNAGTFGCASDALDFSVFGLPDNLAIPPSSDVNCFTGTIRFNVTGGELGCTGSGVATGVRLVSCTGCTGAADPVGTVKAGSTPTFNLPGASAATFAPALVSGGTALCTGNSVAINMTSTYCFGGVLPIGIEYFRGSKLGTVHALQFKVNHTGSDVLTLKVERSVDGRYFTSLRSLQVTALDCNQPFEVLDQQPLNGINYYRLATVTSNGTIRFSNVVSLSNDQNGWGISGVWPNPVHKQEAVTIQLYSDRAGKIQLNLTDVTGKLLRSVSQNVRAGNHSVQLSLQGLAAGTYHITAFKDGMMSSTFRVVKQ